MRTTGRALAIGVMAAALDAAIIGPALTAGEAQGTQPAASANTPPGAALFDQHCATCHVEADRGGAPAPAATSASSSQRIPPVAALRQRTPQAIIDALTSGVMRQQGDALSESERRAIAEYLGSPSSSTAGAMATGSSALCASPGRFGVGQGPQWPGWSPESSNTRFQSSAGAGLTAAQVPRLTLKWAFGFPNATSARALPTAFGGRVFVGSQDGTVYALDAASGCTYWTFKARAAVRTAITISWVSTPGRVSAFFGDGRSNVYALDARTGEQLWTRSIEEHPSSHVTGSVVEYQGRLYVPVASGEEGQGNNPKYECCKFRGSLVALNASTGALVWKTYTIDNEPGPIGKNRSGTTRFGPSGAGIWATPTVDAKRRVVYASTGNMYTEPQQKTSDAVLAFDLDTGQVVWVSQLTLNDVFVVGCNQPSPANCPGAGELGPDFDLGNAPMLVSVPGGRDLLVVGQKSGIGWALDPDNRGAPVWQYRAGQGSALGGMEFGSAADSERAYFPVGDGNMATAGELHAVSLSSGERVWRAMPRPVLCGERGRGCTPGILAAVSVIPGVVFAGSLDGGLRAYATSDGSLLWEYNTNREFTTVNGVNASGASINGPGPVVAGGMVYVNSGYGALGGRAGNVLLAFSPEP